MQARQYVEGLKISPTKVVVVPFGIDLNKHSVSEPSAAPGNWAMRLLQVGRFSPVKGHRFLIETLGKLKPELPPFRLTIAGYEAELKAGDLKKYREEAGLWNQVEIFPNLPDVRPLIAACDIGVVASTGSEVTARVALEFMAAGKPLVASKVGILPELVDENTGWLFEAENIESFGAVIKKALVSRERHPQMGRKARQRVESEYNLEKLADQLEIALQKVVPNA
jgi:glycosyltransferase involved in cell wall biosynthesis